MNDQTALSRYQLPITHTANLKISSLNLNILILQCLVQLLLQLRFKTRILGVQSRPNPMKNTAMALVNGLAQQQQRDVAPAEAINKDYYKPSRPFHLHI